MQKKLKFASIGDCCVDIFTQTGARCAGGTAYNVALHAARSGAVTSIFSAIGTDDNAELFTQSFKQYAIDTTHLQVKPGKTSSIHITLDRQKNPEYHNWDLGVLEQLQLHKADQQSLKQHDIARCVLFKPLIHVFDEFCNMQLPQTLKAADFAGSSSYTEDIRIIERYIHSLDIVIKSIGDASSMIYFKDLAQRYPQTLFLLLQGSSGSTVMINKQIYTQQALSVQTTNTTGAGDAYVAHFLISYHETKDIQSAMKTASNAASQSISSVTSPQH